MNAKSTKRSPLIWRFGMGGVLLAAGTLIDHCTVAAPTVITPAVIANPNPGQPLQTEDQQNQPNEMNVFQSAGQPAGGLPRIFQYGPMQLHPHVDYQFLYGSGIQANPGDQQQTVIQELIPGIVVDFGPHWAFDYTPTIRFYSSDKFKDGVDHSLSLTGGLEYEAWHFGLSHGTQITSAPTVETGTQTDTSTHTTSLSASRALNSSFSTDLAINQTVTVVSGFQDSYDWNTMDWVNYKFWPRLNAGIGAGGGYVLVESDGNGTQPGGLQPTGSNNNLDQTYVQVQARVNWRATDKISFQISGGLEDRQFMTAGTGDSVNPLFGAAIQYQPFATTQISLNANRTAASSDYYLAAQQTETTILGVSVNQRLFRKFNAGVGFAYTKTDYSTAASGAVANLANRSDDLVSFNARLSHPFLKHGTWAVFYQHSENTSSQPGFGFQSDQTGFEVSYGF